MIKNHPCAEFPYQCHHADRRCPDRHKHERHDWVDGAQDIWHCPGRSYARRRCAFNAGSNTQCLLKQNHKGDHNIPCTDHGKHSPHAKEVRGRALLDAKGRPYTCGGRVFDLT